MKKEIVSVGGKDRSPPGPNDKGVPLSYGVKANGFVFVSGMPPFDLDTGKLVKGNIEEQTKQSLENVKAVLEAAGSDLSKVVKATVYCSNSGYFNRINDIYRTYFATEPPARTFVTVGSWPMDFDIEIECVALA